MVNKVVKLDDLYESAITMAKKISSKPSWALQTTKEAINQQQDILGRKQVFNFRFHSIKVNAIYHAFMYSGCRCCI